MHTTELIKPISLGKQLAFTLRRYLHRVVTPEDGANWKKLDRKSHIATTHGNARLKIGQKITYCYHAWQCKTKSTFPQDLDPDHILARFWSSQESPPNLEGQFWIQRPCTSRKDLYKKTVLLIFTPKKLLFFSISILLEFTFYFGQIKM